MSILSNRLHALRAKSGLRQSDVAKKLDVDPSTVSQWETGVKKPRATSLHSLAVLYEISFQELISDVESVENHKSTMPQHGDNFRVIPMPKNLIIEPIDAYRRVVRHDDLPVYQLVSADTPGAIAIPSWQGLRCGEGGNIEPADNEFFLHAPRGEGVNCIRLCGESMEPTFSAGERILIRNMGPISLPSLDVLNGEFANVRRVIERDITHGELYVVSINNEPPQLKRVEFLGDDLDWHLLILPDNRIFTKYLVKKTDEVTFHAKVLGRAK